MKEKLTHYVSPVLMMLIVCLLAFAGMTWTSQTAFAQGSGTEDDPYIMDVYTTDVANPFPDNITDQEIADGIASSQAKHGGRSAAYDSLQYKCEIVLKDGTVVPVYYNDGDAQADWMQKYYGQIKQVKFYLVMPKDDNAQTIMATTFWNDLRLKTNVLSNDSSNTINKNVPMTELKINGENVDPSMVYFKWNGNIKHNAYFEGTFDIPAESPVWMRLISYPVLSGSGIPSTNMQVYQSTLIPRATFHYVLEKDYRKAAGLNATDPIAQRSAGADWSSTAPETALNVPEFKDPLVMSDIFNGRSFFFNSRGALAPYFSVGDTASVNQSFTDDGKAIQKTTERPTYEAAKAAAPLGYVYATDDIDKPADPSDPANFDYTTVAGKGNYYFTPILHADGTMGFDKHYYFIYRQMPAPVTIEKSGPEGEDIPGVKMDLYRVEGDTETLVAKDLTTDESGKIFPVSSESVDQEALRTLTASDTYNEETGYITADGVTYLAPGTYKLKETSVPKAYLAGEKTFTVSSLDKIIESDADAVPVQHVTFKNEKAPTFTAAYTFKSNDGTALPDEVSKLIPIDENVYYLGDGVTAKNPEKTEVTIPGKGVWKFTGYKEGNTITVSSDTVTGESIIFTGEWKFDPFWTPMNMIPTLTASDQTLTVGDVFDPTKDVSATDTEDGDLTKKVTIIKTDVPLDAAGKVNTPGEYHITYQVKDSNGATATKEITVTVKAKQIPPAPATLTVSYTFTKTEGAPEFPAGVTALLPKDENAYKLGDTLALDTTLKAGKQITTPDGTWTFKGWDAKEPLTVTADMLEGKTFTISGMWEFKPAKTEPKDEPKPEPVAEDQKPNEVPPTGDTTVPYALTLGMLATIALGVGITAARKRLS